MVKQTNMSETPDPIESADLVIQIIEWKQFTNRSVIWIMEPKEVPTHNYSTIPENIYLQSNPIS